MNVTFALTCNVPPRWLYPPPPRQAHFYYSSSDQLLSTRRFQHHIGGCPPLLKHDQKSDLHYNTATLQILKYLLMSFLHCAKTTEHVNCVAKSDSSQAIHCPGKFASLDPCSVDSAKNFCGVKIVIPSKNIKGCIRGWTIPINRAPCHQKHLVKYELEHHNIAYEHAFTSCPLVSVYEAHP